MYACIIDIIRSLTGFLLTKQFIRKSFENTNRNETGLI